MIAQADSRKWMACLYNSFLFMEAKIMKMAKKLLAVVLAGVMAVSMLSGCALGDAAKAKALEKALNMRSVQGVADNAKLELEYENTSSLNKKAENLWKNTDATKGTVIDKTAAVAEVKVATACTIGNTTSKYVYYIFKAPKSSEAKKTAEWVSIASGSTGLHKTVKAATEKANTEDTAIKSTAASKAGDPATVKFGTAFVSQTVGGTTTNYVVVVFEHKV